MHGVGGGPYREFWPLQELSLSGALRENSLRRQVLRLQDKACEERKLQEFQIPLQYVAHFIFHFMWQTFFFFFHLNANVSSVSKNRLVLTCV